MNNKDRDFFGNCVLWKKNGEEKRRKKVEGVNYVKKSVREAEAKKRREREQEEKFLAKIGKDEPPPSCS